MAVKLALPTFLLQLKSTKLTQVLNYWVIDRQHGERLNFNSLNHFSTRLSFTQPDHRRHMNEYPSFCYFSHHHHYQQLIRKLMYKNFTPFYDSLPDTILASSLQATDELQLIYDYSPTFSAALSSAPFAPHNIITPFGLSGKHDVTDLRHDRSIVTNTWTRLVRITRRRRLKASSSGHKSVIQCQQ